MTDSGCKGCAERHEGCHSGCERYKKFRKELDEKNERKRLENQAKYSLIEQASKRKEERRRKDKRCNGRAGMYWSDS